MQVNVTVTHTLANTANVIKHTGMFDVVDVLS